MGGVVLRVISNTESVRLAFKVPCIEPLTACYIPRINLSKHCWCLLFVAFVKLTFSSFTILSNDFSLTQLNCLIIKLICILVNNISPTNKVAYWVYNI